jgi:hypothetical protein
VLLVLIMIPVAIAAANILALAPGRRCARLSTAVILRAE